VLACSPQHVSSLGLRFAISFWKVLLVWRASSRWGVVPTDEGDA
jgi:hypothetical protein